MRAEREGRGDTPALDLARAGALHPREQAGRPADARDAGREVPPRDRRRRVRRRRRADHAGGLPRGAGRRDRRRVRRRGRRGRSACPTATTSSTAACRSTTSTSCSASQLPDEEWDTVGGFVFGTLEHVPEVGESVEPRRLAVHGRVEIDGRRVRSLRISRRRCREAAPTPTSQRADAGVEPRTTSPRPADRTTFGRHGDHHSRARSRSSPAHRRASARRSPRRSSASGAKVMLSSRKLDSSRRPPRRSARSGASRCSPPTPATSRPAEACVAGDDRALRRARHPGQQRRHQPVLRRHARRRRGALRQDVRGQPARPAVLDASTPGSRRSTTSRA